MITADYYYPDWECLVDFFGNPGLKNCWHGWPGIKPTTLDHSSHAVRCLWPLGHGIPLLLFISDGSRSKFLWLGLGRVSHLWFGFEFEKFPQKMSNFLIFFPSGQKNLFGSGQKVPGLASYLLRLKSNLGSGRVRSGPISTFYYSLQKNSIALLWIFSQLYWITLLIIISSIKTMGCNVHNWYWYQAPVKRSKMILLRQGAAVA